MKIEDVRFHYLAMPEITTAADGSQDALVVEVSAGGLTGWGECEASPLASIAAFVAPMSHGACRPVAASVLGQPVRTQADIARIAARVAYDSMDLLQAAHTWSGIEMALWDLLGRRLGEPAWRLLGYERAYPKIPYASVLFGADPQGTLEAARAVAAAGYRAVKFGWAPFGAALDADIAHLDAAREGIGPDGILLIDAGQIFGEDVEAAAARLPAMERNRVTWFEEPFEALAYSSYAALARRSGPVRIAGGEAAHDRRMAEHLIEHGGVGYIQIDCGRIGGLGPARRVADFAASRGVTYVNHTFTSNLALSASMQPFAGLGTHRICEYPTGLQPLARELTLERIAPDANGEIHLPDAPGLGVTVDPRTLARYAVDVRIEVGGRTVYPPAGARGENSD